MGAEIPVLRLLALCSSMTKRTQTGMLFPPGRQWVEVCSAGTQGCHSACPHAPSTLLALSTPTICLCKTLVPPGLPPATGCLQTSPSLCDLPQTSSPPVFILPSNMLAHTVKGKLIPSTASWSGPAAGRMVSTPERWA